MSWPCWYYWPFRLPPRPCCEETMLPSCRVCRPRPWSLGRGQYWGFQPVRLLGVATCSCCNKEPAFQRPKIVQSLNASMAPPPCGTCNGACPCETTAPAAASNNGGHFVRNDRRHRERPCANQSNAIAAVSRPARVARKGSETQCDCCGTPSCTCCGANWQTL